MLLDIAIILFLMIAAIALLLAEIFLFPGITLAGISGALFAIGGITLEDVPALMRTGVTGIAVSGAILRAKNPARATRQFIETIHNSL